MQRFLVIDRDRLAQIINGQREQRTLARQLLMAVAAQPEASHFGWLPCIPASDTPYKTDSKTIKEVDSLLHSLNITPLPHGFWPKGAYVFPSANELVEPLKVRPVRQRVTLEDYLPSPEMMDALGQERERKIKQSQEEKATSHSERIMSLEDEAAPIISKMRSRGFPVDKELLKKVSDKLSFRIGKIEKQVYDKLGYDRRFRLTNPRDVSIMLFGIKGRPTDGDALEQLMEDKGHPKRKLAILISRHRTLSSTASIARSAWKAIKEDGRVRCEEINRSDTGRIYGKSPNLMGISKHDRAAWPLRAAFRAEEGYTIVSADLSQIDLRMLAHLSQDKELIKGFREGRDQHRATAAAMRGKGIEDVTDRERTLAKALNFGLIYGQKAAGFAKASRLPVSDAQTYIENFFKVYAGVKEWHEATVKSGRKAGYVKTILGRCIKCDTSKPRVMMNAPVQGSTSDLLLLSIVAMEKRIGEEGIKAELILTIHDEVIYICPSPDVERFKAILKEQMEGAQELAVPIVVGVKSGRTWEDVSR